MSKINLGNAAWLCGFAIDCNMTPTEYAVLSIVFMYSLEHCPDRNVWEGLCFLDLRTISNDWNIHLLKVVKAVRILKMSGILSVENHAKGNLFRVVHPWDWEITDCRAIEAKLVRTHIQVTS